MMIGYADVGDTHTSFEETTSVLSENIKQLIVAMGTDESLHFHHTINKKLRPRTTVT